MRRKLAAGNWKMNGLTASLAELAAMGAAAKGAAEVLKKVSAAGVDLDDVTLNTLVVEGVRKFADSYKSLLSTLEDSMKQLEQVAS